MARNPQYQSIENPIQFDRLPTTRPRIQFELKENAAETFRCASKHVFVLAAVGAVVAFVKKTDLDIDAATEGTYFTLLNIFIVTWAACHVGRTIRHRSLKKTALPLLCAVAAYVYVMLPIDIYTQLSINALFLCLLTWYFGHHWAATCTAAPYPREAANNLRCRWVRYLYIASCIPAAVVALIAMTGSWLVPVIAVSLPLFAQAAICLQKHGLRSCSVARDAVTSWLSYNRDDLDLPGVLLSPAGSHASRIVLSAATVVLTAISSARFSREVFWPSLQFHSELTHLAANRSGFVNSLLDAPFMTTLPGLSILLILFLASLAVPFLIAFTLPPLLTFPVLLEGSVCGRNRVDASSWDNVIAELDESPDPTEANSAYLGTVRSDGSPLLFPFSVFDTPAHFLGDTGSGKTSRGLAPLIEQLIRRRDCSVIVIDLKGDLESMELLGTLQAAKKWKRTYREIDLPLKYFTVQKAMSTFAFNPLTQTYWNNADTYAKADILAGALGLVYGAGYGESYYGAMNTELLHHAFKTYPDTDTLKALAEHILLITRTKDRDLHPDVRKEGGHVHAILSHLASFEAMNVTGASGHADEIVQYAIDFASVFSEPQLHYYFLPCTHGPSASPEIARLITYSLIASASAVQRQHRVYLVIDEFQRMISQNLTFLLQQARSIGVSVILANQAMQDLKTSTIDMIPAIQSNCRFRQWFAVSNSEDQQQLIQGSGETVDIMRSETHGQSGALITSSFQKAEKTAARIGINEVLLTSDASDASFVRLASGDGYAQYGGFVVEVQSNYHISSAEFERRKKLSWPTGIVGSFTPGEEPPDPFANGVPSPSSPKGRPQVTTEIIGSGQNSESDEWKNLFSSFAEPEPDAKKRRNRRPRRKPE